MCVCVTSIVCGNAFCALGVPRASVGVRVWFCVCVWRGAGPREAMQEEKDRVAASIAERASRMDATIRALRSMMAVDLEHLRRYVLNAWKEDAPRARPPRPRALAQSPLSARPSSHGSMP